MKLRDISAVSLWYLHHGSRHTLAPVLVRMVDRHLAIHVFASVTADGQPSVVLLGMDPVDGRSRAYQEVPLMNVGKEADAAWRSLQAGDAVAGEKLPAGEGVPAEGQVAGERRRRKFS